MNPYNRMIWTLLAALLMWLPAAVGVFSGAIEIHIGGLFFVGALLVAYLGVGVVDHVSGSYRSNAIRVQRLKTQIEYLERQAANDAETSAKRRATDQPGQ